MNFSLSLKVKSTIFASGKRLLKKSITFSETIGRVMTFSIGILSKIAVGKVAFGSVTYFSTLLSGTVIDSPIFSKRSKGMSLVL